MSCKKQTNKKILPRGAVPRWWRNRTRTTTKKKITTEIKPSGNCEKQLTHLCHLQQVGVECPGAGCIGDLYGEDWVKCHKDTLRGLIRHSTDRMGETQAMGMLEKQKQRTFPLGRFSHSLLTPGTLTEQRVKSYQIPKESELAAIYGPPWR